MAGRAVKLTKRVVDQVLPGIKPVFVWDKEWHGFGPRVEPTGTEHLVTV